MLYFTGVFLLEILIFVIIIVKISIKIKYFHLILKFKKEIEKNDYR